MINGPLCSGSILVLALILVLAATRSWSQFLPILALGLPRFRPDSWWFLFSLWLWFRPDSVCPSLSAAGPSPPSIPAQLRFLFRYIIDNGPSCSATDPLLIPCD